MSPRQRARVIEELARMRHAVLTDDVMLALYGVTGLSSYGCHYHAIRSVTSATAEQRALRAEVKRALHRLVKRGVLEREADFTGCISYRLREATPS